MTEEEEKLELIHNLVSDYLASGRDLLTSTQKLLEQIMSITTIEDSNLPVDSEHYLDKIIISTDASIKENPGGPASVGFVIRPPGETPLIISKFTNSTTNNEAEYDAIYEALVTYMNLNNKPTSNIVIRSDSKLVVNQLMGKYQINTESLQRRFNSIHELARQIPVRVEIEWRPRNSTPDLATSNFEAQKLLGVKPH